MAATRNGARFAGGTVFSLLIYNKFHGVSLGHWSTVAWIVLVLAALVLLLTEDRLRSLRPTLHVALQPPEHWSHRRLHKHTQALLNDWHRFQTSMWRPDPETYDHVEEMKRRDREELAFRERVSKLEGEYIRRGRLEELTDFTGAQLPSEAAIRVDPLTPAVLRLERLANPVE